MCLLCKSMHCLRHAVHEERGGCLFTFVAVRESNQFLSLRNDQRAEEVRKHMPQGTTQPNVKKVRQVSIGDIIVIRRIC